MGWGGGHGRAKDFKEVTKKTKNHPVEKQTLITGSKEYKTIISLKYK